MPDREKLVMYPHCHHCCWDSKHHPDDAPGHDTPCVMGCEGSEPMAEVALW